MTTTTTTEASSSFFERLSTTTPPRRRRRRSRGEGRRRPGGECVAVVVGKSAILSLSLSLSSALTRVNAQKKKKKQQQKLTKKDYCAYCARVQKGSDSVCARACVCVCARGFWKVKRTLFPPITNIFFSAKSALRWDTNTTRELLARARTRRSRYTHTHTHTRAQ